MKKASYQEALKVFANPYHEVSVTPVSNGLINQSYKVTSISTGRSFLLQQLNHEVFNEPGKLQYNYELLWKFLEKQDIPFFIPEPKLFPDEKTLYRDSSGNYWRVFDFIDDTTTLQVAVNAEQAGAVAETFAMFTSSFSHFDAHELFITIPGFHDISARFKQFKHALDHGHDTRKPECTELVQELLAREKYTNLYDVLISSDEFPLRVMHHDAKIGNVLFDGKTGEVVCPVDFDTAMPGYIFSDLGDMIRSMVCAEDEKCTEPGKIIIRKDFYEAIVNNYLRQMDACLTGAEKKYIHFSGIMITYMQSLRFITDHLLGDKYYHTEYTGQNFERARNQLCLLIKLEEFLKAHYGFTI